MLQKEFKQITKSSLENYGFQYYNKKFYMVLPNIVLRMQYMAYPYDSGFTLSYDFRIKQLSNLPAECPLEIIEKAFMDFSEMPLQCPALRHITLLDEPDIYKRFVFKADDWKLQDWQDKLIKTLKSYFDAFKQNDLKELKKRILSKDNERIIVANQKVEDFLGI